MPYDSQPCGGDKFPLTRWSVIDAARSTDEAARDRALATLFAAYWRPVYKYIRIRWNRPPEDAQDLTQGFFAELLERDLLAKYDPAKSRLRTYLRICADSFVMNQEKVASRQKEELPSAKDRRRKQRTAQRELDEEEAQIASLEARIATLSSALEDPELYTRTDGVEEANRLGAELDRVRRELDEAFARWSAASEMLQGISQR